MNPLASRPQPPQGQAPRRTNNPLQMKIGTSGPTGTVRAEQGHAAPMPQAEFLHPQGPPIFAPANPQFSQASNPQQPYQVNFNQGIPPSNPQAPIQRRPTNPQLSQSFHGHKNPLVNFAQGSDANSVLSNPRTPRSTTDLNQGGPHQGAKPFTYHYTPDPLTPVRLGTNIWENYQLLGQEIQKRNQKLHEVNAIIKQMRISNDPNQIAKFQNQLANTRHEIQRISADNQQVEAHIQELTKRSQQSSQAQAQKDADYQRVLMLMRSPAELKAQLAQLKTEHDQIRAGIAKMDYDAKIQLDKESREAMEERVLKICLDAASRTNEPRVKELAAKIQAAQLKR